MTASTTVSARCAARGAPTVGTAVRGVVFAPAGVFVIGFCGYTEAKWRRT